MIKKIAAVISKREKLELIWILFLIVVGSAFELMGVGIFMPFIEVITTPTIINTNQYLSFFYQQFHFNNATDFLASIALVIIFIYIFKNIFLIWQKNHIYKYSYRIQRRISVRLLSAYMHEPYTFHLNKNIAELQRGLVTDTDYFAKAVIHGLELLSEVVVCLALGVYLFTVSHSITLVIVGILILAVLFFALVAKKITADLSTKAQKSLSSIIQEINESLGGIKEVKILGREQKFIDSYDELMVKYLRCLRIVRVIGNMPKYVVEAVCMCGMLLAVILKLYFGQNEMQSFIPQLGVFAVAAFRLLPSVGRISEHYNALLTSLPSVNVIYQDILDINVEEQEEVGSGSSWDLGHQIEIRHVSYSYPGTEQNVIDDVSFVIPKGKTVAFIGGSGAGKTTMADIILGLLVPQRGKIFADERNIFQDLHAWQHNIGYIPQVIYLADDSIRNNIAFGIAEKDIDQEAVKKAAEKAQLLDFIDTLSDGFDTIVGDRGARISGGQRQRIGIARALYHDPEFLVLDEATSALDNETETAVMDAINSLHGSKTILIIAHRLTTIRNADIIYEVDAGKVVTRDKESVLSSVIGKQGE